MCMYVYVHVYVHTYRHARVHVHQHPWEPGRPFKLEPRRDFRP